MHVKNVRISGTGMYVPDNVVTNKDLEKIMDTSDGWIVQRTGIKECLDECMRMGRIKPGGLVVMAAFGSGFTWGASLVRF